jgi:hypothetical protein
LRSRSRPQRRNTCPLDRGSGSSSWSSCSTCPRDTRLTPSSRRRRSSRLQGSACSRCCWRRRWLLGMCLPRTAWEPSWPGWGSTRLRCNSGSPPAPPRWWRA